MIIRISNYEFKITLVEIVLLIVHKRLKNKTFQLKDNQTMSKLKIKMTTWIIKHQRYLLNKLKITENHFTAIKTYSINKLPQINKIMWVFRNRIIIFNKKTITVILGQKKVKMKTIYKIFKKVPISFKLKANSKTKK